VNAVAQEIPTDRRSPIPHAETGFHRIALLIGIFGTVATSATALARRGVYYLAFASLESGDAATFQLWIEVLRMLPLPIFLLELMIATGAYSFLRLNGSRCGLPLVVFFALPLLVEFYGIGTVPADVYVLVTTATSWACGFVVGFFLWQTRSQSQRPTLLASAAIVAAAKGPLGYVTDFLIGPALYLAGIPRLPFQEVVLKMVVREAIYVAFLLMLAMLFLAERRSLAEQDAAE
jgi:hypothetical protein